MSSFTSIRTKTSFLFFILFVGIILPVNWIIYQEVQRVLIDASRKEMMIEAEKIMDQIKLDPLIVPVSTSYDIRLHYQDNFHEEILFSSPHFPNLPFGNSIGDYYTYDTLEVVDKSRDERAGVLTLSLSRSSRALNERLADLKFYSFLLSSASILVAAVLVYLAAGWMLRPIHKISKAADKIQAAESIERVPVPNTNDESKVLANALNEMLSRIERTIKNQTNFFASATHELKTPLAVMKAEVSSFDVKNDERLGSLLTEIERLDRIISDFLLISQLKAESLVIRKKDEAIDELIYRSLRKLKHVIPGTQQPPIHITLDNQHTDYVCKVDTDKMETVFVNLIENALRYSSPRSVSILLKRSDSQLQTEISNPVAKDIADVNSLQQEFRKSRELSSGLGMGLWICQQILKLHEGTLTLSCHDRTFTVIATFPIA